MDKSTGRRLRASRVVAMTRLFGKVPGLSGAKKRATKKAAYMLAFGSSGSMAKDRYLEELAAGTS